MRRIQSFWDSWRPDIFRSELWAEEIIFIELQEDDQGMLAVMIHSGSRHFGKSVCDYFHYKARQLNQKWYSQVPDEYRLAFLPVDSPEGRQYLRWMQLSMDFCKGKPGKDDAGSKGDPGKVYWKIYGAGFEVFRRY